MTARLSLVLAVIGAAVLVFAAGPLAVRESADPPGWSSFPPPPFPRARAVSVWTGSALFHWGGDTDYAGSHSADGALFDPASRIWTRLSRGPLAGRSLAGAVWTGKEVLIWGGWRRVALGDGAAFDPVGNTWRLLPRSPLSPRVPLATVWTGREMIVWRDASRRSAERSGAAYDPAADRWRRLPRAPFALNQASGAWTGREVIVLGALLDGNNRSKTKYARGMAYDPRTNTWRVLARSRLSPQASTLAWIGTHVLAWDYLLAAATYHPGRNSWHRLPALPLRASECYPDSAPVGPFAFAWYCGQAALFDAEARRWCRVSVPRGVSGVLVPTGDTVMFVGASHEGTANAFWVYRPGGSAARRCRR